MIREPGRLKRFANQYDQSRKPSALILDVLNECLRTGSACTGLDLGCGTGNYTLPFLTKFKHVAALDILAEMLEVGRSKGSTSVGWVQAQALEQPFVSASFDSVWAISVLHYFLGDRQPLLFKEVRRILKAGGVFVADTEFAEQHPSLWIVEYFPSLRDRYRDAVFSRPTYERWLRTSGFQSVEFVAKSYEPTESDGMLRIGQHAPKLYLDPRIRAGLPAFREMAEGELNEGLSRLQDHVRTGEIWDVIDRYARQATLDGDLGFIVAVA